ncbi:MULTISPECIES: DUF4083 family protein [Bacillus]|uniref:DUF4083 family protein n=1 Tax=Bacillus TaxID=1386 RepID=UPI000BB91FE6|nr:MULTISPECIES: DUF4083 family protein [Bacillus]
MNLVIATSGGLSILDSVIQLIVFLIIIAIPIIIIVRLTRKKHDRLKGVENKLDKVIQLLEKEKNNSK